MNNKKQQNYLFKNGFLDGNHTKEEIEAAKEVWKKKREKNYRKDYKKKHHQKYLLFTLAQ